MRVGIVSWTRRRVGGVETYLSRVIPAIVRAGHAVAFLSEVDEPADRVEGSLAVAVLASSLGADVVRVHDVAATVRALKVADAVVRESADG